MKCLIILVSLLFGVSADAQQYRVTELLTELAAKTITLIPGSHGAALIFVGDPRSGE